MSEKPLHWLPVNLRDQAAWSNEDDATRDGAYSLSIAVVEVELGLYAVSRAETRTGADYYVNSPEMTTDLEKAYRLEVSGTDDGNIGTRLKRKIKQAKEGDSDKPAIACIVGWKERRVAIAKVEGGDEQS